MYLRITRVRFDPARYDELMSLSREINSAVQGLPGCQGSYQGVDRTAGAIAAVSLWDTEEHARFTRDTLGEVMTRVQALGVQLEPPDIYEIIG